MSALDNVHFTNSKTICMQGRKGQNQFTNYINNDKTSNPIQNKHPRYYIGKTTKTCKKHECLNRNIYCVESNNCIEKDGAVMR